jgi:hypothetical protein
VRDAAGELPDIPASPLVYYFSDGSAPSDNTGSFHALTEDVLRPADPVYPIDDACHNTSALFNCSSEVRGIVFPQGTRSVLFFGRQGLGNICYGQGTSDKALHGQFVDPVNDPDVNYCFDPADHNKGFHAWPYAHYVWAYDALDFKRVRDGLASPWDLKPYKVFRLNLPLDTTFGDAADVQSRRIGGAAYDPSTGRVFLSQMFDDGRSPIIHVFKMDLGTPPPPPPAASAAARERRSSTRVRSAASRTITSSSTSRCSWTAWARVAGAAGMWASSARRTSRPGCASTAATARSTGTSSRVPPRIPRIT